MYLRAMLITLLLISDSLIGQLRSIPPASFLYASLIFFLLISWVIWKVYLRQGLPRTPVTIPFIIYLAAIGISTVFSVDPRRSLEGFLGSVVIILIFFIISDLILAGWKPETFEWSQILFVSFLLVQGLWKIIQWYSTWFSVRVPEYPTLILEYRLFGVSSWPNILGMLIYVTLPFVIFRMADSKSKMRKAIWFVWLIFAEIVFFYADSRGALIASFIVLVMTITWLIFRKRIPFRGNLKEWFLSNTSILISLTFFISLYWILNHLFRSTQSHTGFVLHGGGFSGGRFYFWEIAFEIFKGSPLFGSGLGTYPRFYLEANPSGINGWISPHAHNIFFDTISSMGVMGLFALLLILFVFSQILIRDILPRHKLARFIGDVNQRYIIGGAIALLAFLAHSLVDRLTAIPHSIIPVLLILALFLNGMKLIILGEQIRSRYAIVFLLIILMGFFFIIRVNIAQDAQLKSLPSSYSQDWQKGVNQLAKAINFDKNLDVYNEQLGFAQGALALSSENDLKDQELNEAISIYIHAIDKYSYWAPNYVNLAELYENSGEPFLAINALESIPRNWRKVWNFPDLLLADKYESQGNYSKSEELYQSALSQNIWSKDLAICRQSKICQENASLDIYAESTDYQIHNTVTSLIDDGYPEQAQSYLNEIPFVESSALVWIERALVHLKLGEIKQSEFAILVAEKLNAFNQPSIAPYFALTKAKIYIHNNKFNVAIEILEAIERPVIQFRTYESILYQRIGFASHLLPTLAMLEKSKYDLDIYEELEKLYLEEDRRSEAGWARNQARILEDLLLNE